MNTLIQYIKSGKATRATSMVETALKSKTMDILSEERKRVAAITFGEAVTEKPFDRNRLQGVTYNHDTDHDKHPFHSTLEKHGFKYDHSGSQGEHHYTHSDPKHAVHNVMVRKNDYQPGKHQFTAAHTKTYGGAHKTGDSAETLTSHLSKMQDRMSKKK